jgi:hypothetical protein
MTRDNGVPAARRDEKNAKGARVRVRRVTRVTQRISRKLRRHAMAREWAVKIIDNPGRDTAGAPAGDKDRPGKAKNRPKPPQNSRCHVFVRKSEKLEKRPLTVRRTRRYKHPTFGAADAAPQTSSL